MGRLVKGIGGIFQAVGKVFGLEMELEDAAGPYNDDLLTNDTAPTSYIGVVYGYRRKAGVRIATFVRGNSNQYLYAVYALSHGPVSGVFNPRMNDVAFSHPHSEPYVDWSYMDGSNTQDATTNPLIIEIGAEWDTVNGKLQGVAFAIVKLTLNKEYMSEFGNITFDVAGRKVYDPRTAITSFSDNPSLCVLDYLTNPIYGKGLSYPQDFDVNSYIDAANYFDETTGGVIAGITGSCKYSLKARKDGYLSVDATTFNSLVAGDTYEVTGFVAPSEDYTGAIISKSTDTVLSFSGGVEPVPVYTPIYLVFMGPLADVTRALITSPISITFSKKPKRYTCNGNVDTSQQIYENLVALSTSFNGYVTFFNGLSTIIPDRPEPVAASFNESNITGDITIQLPNKSSQLNEITGTWFDPEFGYEQSTDTVKSEVFLSRDKGRKQPKEINLPFCNSSELLQRILTIELNKSRHNGPIQMTTFWDALEVLSGEVIEVSDTELGWVNRTFRVVRIGIPDVYNDVELTCTPYDADDYIDGVLNPRRLNDYVDYTVAGKMDLPTSVTVERIYDIDNLLVKVSWTPTAGIPYDHFDLEVYAITRDGMGVINSSSLEFTYINIYTTNFSIPDTLVDEAEYQFRVYVWSPSKQRSSIFSYADYIHGQLQPPTGITVSVDGPWAVSAVPTYPVERAGQVKLTHKWYISESVAQAEPPFAEGDLVYSGPELIWAGLKPNKDYRIWCKAVTDYDVSATFPAGNGQSFSTPDTVDGDLGSAAVDRKSDFQRNLLGKVTGDSWTDAEAILAITADGSTPTAGDSVLLYNQSIGFAETKFLDVDALTWLPATEVNDGNLLVKGTVGADKLIVEEIFALDITATGSITGAVVKTADSGTRAVMSTGAEPLSVYAGETKILGISDAATFFKGPITGVGVIGSMAAFTPGMQALLQSTSNAGEIPTGGTQNLYNVAMSSVAMTSRSLTINPANASNINISVSLSDAKTRSYATAYDVPQWRIKILRGATTLHNVVYSGLTETLPEADSPLSIQSFSFNKDLNITDAAHGTALNGTVTYTVEVTKVGGDSFNCRLDAFSISQPIQGSATGSTTLAALTDTADFATTAPTDQQVLTWDTATGLWIAADSSSLPNLSVVEAYQTLRITSDFGTTDIGMHNSSFTHFVTSATKNHFNRPVYITTGVYVYGTGTYLTGTAGFINSNAIYHAGNLLVGDGKLSEFNFTSAYKSKLDFVSVTQSANLDTMAANIETNNAKAGNVAGNLSYASTTTSITVSTTNGSSTTLPAATALKAGLMKRDDKTKLDGIAPGANNYTHPTISGYKHLPVGGSAGKVLKWDTFDAGMWVDEVQYYAGTELTLTGTTFNVSSDTAATANKIVKRNASGDILARYLNINHGRENRVADDVFYSSIDNYVRKNNAAGFRSSLNVYNKTERGDKHIPTGGATNNILQYASSGKATWSNSINVSLVTTETIDVTSSRELKNIDHVEDIHKTLKEVVAIGSQGVKIGHYKTDKNKIEHNFFIAEEVHAVDPKCTNELGTTIRPPDLLAKAYSAIAALESRLTVLENK